VEVTSTIVSVKYTGAVNKVANVGRVSNVTEIKGFKASGGTAIVRYVKNKTDPIGENNMGDVKKWGLRIDFKNPESTAYVSVEKNDTVVITSTGPYERVLRFLHKYYFPGIFYSEVKVSKIDGRTHVDASIDLDELGRELANKLPRSAGYFSYERELYAGGQLNWVSPKVTLILFNNGTILFLGAKSMDVIKQVQTIFKELFYKYGVDMKGTLIRRMYRKKPLAARKNLAAKRKKGAGRYETAFGYDNTKEGFYVRPGANKEPRFYPVPSPSKLPLVRQKVLRAYTNAGVPIPQNVKNLFGFNVSVQLKEKAEIRRAKNWSDVKAGFYVRPGPGGQPYFYKIPKGIAAGRKTVIAAYQTANRRIPSPVRAIFNIPASLAPRHLPVEHMLNRNNKGELRLNGKQMGRYTHEQLLKVARNLNIPGANAKMKIVALTNAIKTKLGSPPLLSPGNANLILNGVPISFLMNGRVMRGKRARQWSTLKAAEQNAIAKEYLVNTNYANWVKVPKKDQYMTILALKAGYNKPVVFTPSPSPNRPAPSPARAPSPPRPASASPKSALMANLKRQVEAAFGNKYKHLLRNHDVANLYREISNLPKGARGKPLQANVNKTITVFLKQLKLDRQYAQVRQNYRNSIQISNNLRRYIGSNANVERYKNMAVNLMIAPNPKGVLPKKKDVQAALKTWLRLTYPPGSPARPRMVENMETGEMRMIQPPNRSKVPSPKLGSPGVKRISPLKVAKRQPAFKRPRKPKAAASPASSSASPPRKAPLGPAVGPIKKPPPGASSSNSNSNSLSRSASVNMNRLVK
jgi:hypothetical protein